MGSIWLNGSTPGYPNVLDVLQAAGVSASGYEGWTTRSRSSGGFSGFYGIVAHHTASKTSVENDLHYMVYGCPDKPVSNGLLDRTGHFTVIGAGATNHAGKGGGTSDGGGSVWNTSSGTVPGNSANSYCFGIEAANDGVGEPWPQAQQDAYVLMCHALCEAYGFVVVSDLRSHNEWTPPRKIDPRGPSKWQPANANSPWNMDLFRQDVSTGIQPPEDDQVTEDDINAIAAKVWAAMIHNYVDGQDIPAVSMLGFAHAEAYGGNFDRGAENMVNGETQAIRDLIRFAHAEAYSANQKCDQILAHLGLTPGGASTGKIG